MQKTLARNAAFNIVYRVLNVVFPLITTAHVSRVLTPEGIGNVAYAQNIVSYFVMFAVLGIPRYGTREIAKNRNDLATRNKLFTEIVIINTISTAVCALLYYIVVLLGVFQDALIYFVCGIELLFNFINIDWLYEGEEEYAYIAKRSVLIKFLAIVALFIFVKDKKDYPIYAFVTCLGLGCNHILNVFHARKYVKLTFRNLEIGKHCRPVLVLALSALASSLYGNVNITMLGWLSNTESVGYYNNAHKVVNMVLTLVTAVSSVFMPRLSYLYPNDIARYRKLITIGAKIVLFLAIPCAVGIALVAEDAIIVLFGELFLPAKWTLRIMSVLTIIIGVGDLLCYQAIISSGKERLLIRSRIYAGIANMVLSMIFVPLYQHAGAAIALVVSEIIVNGMLLKQASQITKLCVDRGYVFKLIIGVTAMTVVVCGVQFVVRSSMLSLVVAVGMGALTYLVIEKMLNNDFLLLIRQLKNLDGVSCDIYTVETKTING